MFLILLIQMLWVLPVHAEEIKPYTVLVYMIGSDLESENAAATADIREMEEAIQASSVPLDEKMNLVVEYGGCTTWQLSELRQAGFSHGRFCLTSDGISNLMALEPANMGEPDTLESFLEEGVNQYPAERYILIFWDHGEGPVEGFGYDELNEGDSLTLLELAEVFETAKEAQYSFELVGFDACLMGSLELAYQMPDNVRYLAVSPESEPMDGWNYAWMSVLADDAVDGKEIGKRIIDDYMAYYQAKEETLPLTMALWDCAQAKPFGNELGEMVQSQCRKEGRGRFFQRISEQRMNYYGYDNPYNVHRVPQLIDCMDLAEDLYACGGLGRQRLNTLYKHAVCYSKSLNTDRYVSGVSLYLPSRTNPFLLSNRVVYRTLPFCLKYQKFVETYTQYLVKGKRMFQNTEVWTGEDEIFLSLENPEDICAVYGLTALYDDKNDCYTILSEHFNVEAGEREVSFFKEQEYICCGDTILYGRRLSEEGDTWLCPIICDGETYHLAVDFSGENAEILGLYPLENGGRAECDDFDGKETMIPLYPCSAAGDIQADGKIYAKGTLIQLKGGLLIQKKRQRLEDAYYGFLLMDNAQNETYRWM